MFYDDATADSKLTFEAANQNFAVIHKEESPSVVFGALNIDTYPVFAFNRGEVGSLPKIQVIGQNKVQKVEISQEDPAQTAKLMAQEIDKLTESYFSLSTCDDIEKYVSEG